MILMNNIHVIPIDDLKPHIEKGLYCKCNPRIDSYTNGKIIIHNSWDGREFFEIDSANNKNFSCNRDWINKID